LNNDPYRLFRCRTIMNCTEVCPRGLSPSRAIERIRLRMLKVEGDDGGLALHRVPTIK
jgi:succinate dehydrogenase / fumarate reductase, iron-sulfur subunit